MGCASNPISFNQQSIDVDDVMSLKEAKHVLCMAPPT